MHIEFFLEESSCEAAIQNIAPRILSALDSFAVHPHQGKSDLLAKLPSRLRGYRYWLPEDWCVFVIVDLDNDNCEDLKRSLEETARASGLSTRSHRQRGGRIEVMNRIAIEELEAWFFGDVEAIRGAYPRVPESLGQRARFRDPDAIVGGTCEALERELQRYGYFPGGLSKITAATEISRYMDPARNRSKSFQVFRDGLRELTT
jgi:hypothetical protein